MNSEAFSSELDSVAFSIHEARGGHVIEYTSEEGRKAGSGRVAAVDWRFLASCLPYLSFSSSSDARFSRGLACGQERDEIRELTKACGGCPAGGLRIQHSPV